LNKTISEVTATLDAYRAKVTALTDELKNPGDLLARVDALGEASRKAQQAKIDDVAGRTYNDQTDKYEIQDAGIIETLESVEAAMSVPFPAPSYLALEEIQRVDIRLPGATGIETWFVGDF